MRTLLVLSLVLLAALAGCSKAPPSGTLANGGSGLTGLSGSADIAYQEAVYPAGQVPVVGPMACAQPPAPPQAQCTPASSSFHVHFMALPTPEGTYDVVLAGGAGSERNLGSLAVDTGSMWDFNATINEDLNGQFQRVEVRMGDFVLATAPATEGPQPFALAAGLDAVQAAGSYKGKVLNVTVSGLPGNGTYVGRLYTNDTQSGLLTVAESFPVHNGANEFTAKVNVADYAEFHIHVGNSLVNLYKMKVPQ